MTKNAVKYFITLLLTTVISISPANAMICTSVGQKYTCAGTPPICPQGQSACTSTPYSISGSASVSPTPVSNQNGFDRITVNAGGIYFYGWSCTGSICSEISASGNLTVTGDSVSGSVSAGMITSVIGNGEKLDFYNGSTLAGSITVSGSTFTGSANASNGLLSVSAVVLSGSACPGLYTWNSSDSQCELAPQCSSGTYNQSRNRCEQSTGNNCPGSYTWNSSDSQCELAPQCSSGTYNQTKNRCESMPGYSCPSGYTGSGSACTANPFCPSGSSFDTGAEQCAQSTTVSYSCPSSWTLSGSDCTQSTTTQQTQAATPSYGCCCNGTPYCCSVGSACGIYYTDLPTCQSSCDTGCSGSCTQTGSNYKCPVDGYLNPSMVACNNHCRGLHGNCTVASYSCPSGWTLSGSDCTQSTTTQQTQAATASYSCPSGWTLSGSTCYRAANCPAGGSLSGSTCQASSAPACSSGTYDSTNNICYLSAMCPNNGTLNGTVGKCQVAESSQCLSGMTYDSTNGVCYVATSCPNGGSLNGSVGECQVSLSSGTSLTFTGMVCNGSNCSVSTVGSITMTGASYYCPLGTQYSCSNMGSGYACSNISCIDTTLGGQFPPGAQVCASDLNGNGIIEPDEIQQCVVSFGTCPPGGTYDSITASCTASTVTSYSCPTTSNTYGDLALCQAACQHTSQCVPATVTGTGSFNFTQTVYAITGSDNCLVFIPFGGGGFNTSICFTGGISFSGSITPPESGGCVNGLTASADGMTLTAPLGNTLMGSCSGNIGTATGSITVNGGIVSGGSPTINGIYSGSTSGNQLKLTCPGCPTATLTFNSGILVCPADGFPCMGSSCTYGSDCVNQNVCPTNYQMVSNQCTAISRGAGLLCPIGAANCATGDVSPTCPEDGTFDPTTHMCEAPVTKSCTGSGFSYDATNDTCVKNVDCGKGMLDTSIGRCMYALSNSDCPSGFTYSSSYAACIEAVTCDLGGIYNALRSECEIAGSSSCSNSYTYNSSLNVCQANLSCDAGSFNSAIGQCEVPASELCPIGYTFNPSSVWCELSPPPCPSGSSYSSSAGMCMQAGTYGCPSGGSYNSATGKCVSSDTPTCSGGQTYDSANNVCYVSATCSGTGAILNGSTGMCDSSGAAVCPGSYTWNSTDSQCELTPQCPSGTYNQTRNRCEAAPGNACPSGGSYNSTTGKCESSATPTCSGGTIYDSANNVCYVSATCSGTGAILNGSTGMCDSSGTAVCPGSYTWNSTDSQCELTPQCSQGTYNQTRDRCELASNYTCSLGGNYSTLSACQTACVNNGTCNLGGVTVTASGSFSDGSYSTSSLVGSNNCLKFYYSFNSVLNYGGQICFSGGVTFAGTIGNFNSVLGRVTINNATTIVGTYSGGNPSGSITVGCGGSVSGYCGPNNSTVNIASASSSTMLCGHTTNSGPGLTVTAQQYTCSLNSIKYCTSSTCTSACTQSGTCTGPCTSGTTYDSGNNVCYLSATCPNSGTLNGTAGECQVSPSSYTCQSGYTWNSTRGVCETTPQCSSGTYNQATNRCEQTASNGCASSYTYNSSTGLCEATSTPTCSAGTYDLTNNVCYVDATCPNSGMINGTVGECQVSPSSYTCQSGYTWNSTRGICEAPPLCSPGTYTQTRNRCEQSVSYGCPSSYVYNSSTGLCESAPSASCLLTGFSYNSSLGLCTQEIVCPSGGTMSGVQNLCYIQVTSALCPSGFIFTASAIACLAAPSCPGGGTFNPADNVCKQNFISSCPANYLYNSSVGVCAMVPVCTTGKFDAAIGMCGVLASTLCPANYTYNSITSRCEENPPCDTGSTFLTTINECAEDPIRECPTSDYKYSISAKACQASPICTEGIFDSTTNMCGGATQNCPYGQQYPCVSNPASGGLQCSKNSCIDPSKQQTQTTSADLTGYTNDGKIDQNTGQCSGQVYIFNGKASQCREAGISTMFFNCCNTDPGSWLFIQNTCGTDDLMTSQRASKKLCHYVGDYCQQKWPLVGCVQSASVYCCFNSQLGRIIQEQGRPQLQTFQRGFGSAENPDCRGFRPEEFENLDFSKIDLSEYVNGIVTTSQQTIANTMKTGIRNYYNNLHINK